MTRYLHLLICLAALMTGSVLADDATTKSAPTTKPAATTKPATPPAIVADALTSAVDPYDVADQKTKFLRLAGNTGELDAKTFDADRKAGGGLIMPFEKWDTAVTFDKDKNKTLDWLEFDAYRQAMRKAVLAACDKNKDNKLTGDERVAALKLLADGKLVIKPDPERAGPLPPMFGASRASEPMQAFKKRQAEYKKYMDDYVERYDELHDRLRKMTEGLSKEEFDVVKNTEDFKALRQAAVELEREQRKVGNEFHTEWLERFDKNKDGIVDEDEVLSLLYEQEEEDDWPKPWRDFSLRNFDTDGDGKLNETEWRAAHAFQQEIWKTTNDWRLRVLGKDIFESGAFKDDAEHEAFMKEWSPVWDNLATALLRKRFGLGDKETPSPEALKKASVQVGLLSCGVLEYMLRFEEKPLADNGGKASPATRTAMLKALDADMRKRIQKFDAGKKGYLSPEEGERLLLELMDEFLKLDHIDALLKDE